MSIKNYKLSIITINLNNLIGLKKTFESVINQQFSSIEYIIIDGGSTDGSLEFIKENADKISYWISEKDEGVYQAINKGIIQSNGSYLMFLNSGDFLIHSNVIEASFNSIKQETDVLYGGIEYDNGDGTLTQLMHNHELSIYNWRTVTINHQAAIYKRDLFDRFGLYDVTFGLAADHAFHITAYINGAHFQHYNAVMVNYNLEGLSSKPNNPYPTLMEIAYQRFFPTGVYTLILEHEKMRIILLHKIMRIAKKINDYYIRFKKNGKNKK